MWWTSLLALLYVALQVGEEDETSGGRRAVILAGFVFTFIPWLLIDRPAVFIFYLLPTVPFMCLAIGYVVTQIGRSWEAKAAVALFSRRDLRVIPLLLPVAGWEAAPATKWNARIWVFDNCDKPVGATVTATITETVGRRGHD